MHSSFGPHLSFSLVLVLCLGGCSDEDTWRPVASELDEALLAVHGTSERDVWVVGADLGRGPIVLRYDGEGWSRVATGTRGHLWWVHAFEEGPVFLGGSEATILRYDEGVFTRMKTPGVSTHTVYGIWGRSPTDVYAVGSIAGGREGFIWHYDGREWREVVLPRDLPKDARGSIPGFFKVWGHDDQVWVVGGRGLALRASAKGPFEIVPTGSESTLFTVHASDGYVAAVGGGGNGVLVELGDGASDRTPDGAPLLQGLCLGKNGDGYAAGAHGRIWRRRAGAWLEEEHELELGIESLHSVWVDPAGGVWAAGGNVVSSRLDRGALVHRGRHISSYSPEPSGDAGTSDGAVPQASCPPDEIDPRPDGSIARRWNEALLAAIRRAVPRPTVHARNLFHTSIAMWDAWASYDDASTGVVVRERQVASDVDRARTEAISYAAYRVLTHRYRSEVGGDVSLACFGALMEKLGFDPDDDRSVGNSPRALGNRIGMQVLARYANDGANEADDYRDPHGYESVNPPLIVDQAGTGAVDPERWQPLNLSVAVTQNGLVTEAGMQGYIGPHWGEVTPFALERPGPDRPYFDGEPGPRFDDALVDQTVELIRLSSYLDPSQPDLVDVSPAVWGNNPLGTNDGTGHGTNPITGAPYPSNVVTRADFGRTIAEIWADGPNSETPPGHWNAIANEISDDPRVERRLFGEGAALERLEWDVKIYLALNGAVHDAAIAAWELKRVFDSSRPITLVRYMGQRGQRSDPNGPSYHPEGLPLIPGLIEVITEESSAEGGPHAHLAPYVGQIAVRSWRGEPGDRDTETGGVGWIRAVDWMPYQRRTFVTPAFPGYVSGHSTFSRAAAEVLTALTGSPYFPGGLGEIELPTGYLVFEGGPERPIRLSWATYYDAADQAGQSRLWGGIHIAADDFVGRRIGSEVGLRAVEKARTYFEGRAD